MQQTRLNMLFGYVCIIRFFVYLTPVGRDNETQMSLLVFQFISEWSSFFYASHTGRNYVGKLHHM